VGYSTRIEKGDRVLLDMMDVPDEFTIELIRTARAAGATPLPRCGTRGFPASFYSGQMKSTPRSFATSNCSA